MGRFKWTPERISILTALYATASWEELCAALGTSNKAAIHSKASALSLSRDCYNDCHVTDAEKQFLCEHAATMTGGEMARALGRNTTFVSRIMRRLGLTPLNRGLRSEDIERFKELYPYYTNAYLSAQEFPYLTPQQLRTQARKLHLEKADEKNHKWYSPDLLIMQFEEAVRSHGRVPMLQELQDWGLPPESTVRRYFGSFNALCALIQEVRPNYNRTIAGDGTVYQDLAGNTCYSLSEVRISNFLVERGIAFEKEIAYAEVMPKDVCRTKRFDWKIGSRFIEFFGLCGYRDYDDSAYEKIALCQQYNVELLPLFPDDLAGTHWQDKILKFLDLE